jgi:streptogramin lyase
MLIEFAPLLPALVAALCSPRPVQEALLVTSRTTDEVLRYDGTNGAFLGVFAAGGGLDNPVGLTFGPDGNLYVASGDSNQVLRYDGVSGAFLDVFVAGPELDGPRQVNFGPDGHLYVASGTRDVVLRYDGRTGVFLDTFATGGGLNGPTSFTFGPAGDLFVGSVLTDRVKRYDGRSGVFLGNFVSARIDGPHDLAFGPDGHLYVSNAFVPRIARFDGRTGAFRDVFVNDPALTFALGLGWDGAGRLVVANQGRNEVRRYDGETGALLDVLVAPGSGGLAAPLFVAFEPRRGFQLDGPRPGLAAATNLVTVSGARPGAHVWLGVGQRTAAWLPPDCPLPRGLPGGYLELVLTADESGRAFLSAFVPRSFAGRAFFLRALEPLTCRASPLTGVRF